MLIILYYFKNIKKNLISVKIRKASSRNILQKKIRNKNKKGSSSFTASSSIILAYIPLIKYQNNLKGYSKII